MSEINTFIKNEIEKRKRDYSDSPDYILEHYNGEQKNIQAYNGRQLFEMLQNADDEAFAVENPKALIKLCDKQLIIANNGRPFSEDGFRSLIYSDNSPKPMQYNKIGQKGLGFRSILSWADEVVINSGGARISFSEKRAKLFLIDLIENFPHIRKFLNKKSKKKYPIATLRIPHLLDGIDELTDEYDTVISIQLKDEILDDVQSQISNIISKETLLFLNNLKTIEIDSPKTKITFNKYINKENNITIESYDILTKATDSKTWTIKKDIGVHEYIEDGVLKEKNYELVIAWNKDLDDKENTLYSYFKTQVRFPFPALLHGTFELSADRNQLVNDTFGHNQFLTEKLSELLIETALEIASKSKSSSYLPLKLLKIEFDKIDPILTTFNFKNILIEKIKSSKIFPNVNGEYICYKNNPVYYDYPIADILKGEDVNNLMPHSKDKELVTFIKSFKIFCFDLKKYFSRISSRLGELNYSEIAKLIYHLLTYETHKKDIVSNLFKLSEYEPILLNSEGDKISWDSIIFLPTQDNKSFKLPKSLNISFVNSKLIESLLKEFDNDYSNFIKNIEKLSAKEYSFKYIASSLIQHYNNKTNLISDDVKELHIYLFRLFKREIKKIHIEKLSNESAFVITKNKKIKTANEVYFGKDYDNEIAEKLYSYDKSKILAASNDFGLENEDQNLVIKYFQWLGLENFPRYSLISLPQSSEFQHYKEYVLRNFDYEKVEIGTYYNKHYKSFDNYNKFLEEFNYSSEILVGYFDDLKNILIKSKPEVIFSWIKADAKLKSTLHENKEILSAAIFRFHLKRKPDARVIRFQALRSYTRWLFATTPWLPVESESKKAEPDTCCLSRTITKEFSPFVEKPKIDFSLLADRLQVPEDTIESYLLMVGVHREIKDFSTERLYKMLFSLPFSDEKGNVAKSIYREIIKNFDDSKLDVTHPAYIKFVNHGRMLCIKGREVGYFPVSEAYYIYTKNLGRNVLKRFPLAEIDPKQGNQKVKKLFGVKPLDKITFNILTEPLNHILQDTFHEEIQRFKAFVYALRYDQDTTHQILKRLKALKIILSTHIEAEFIHNNKKEPFELEKFEFVRHKNKPTFFVLVPETINDISELKDDVDFCDSISDIFTTLISTEEYRSFIRELYSKREGQWESLLKKEIQQETDETIVKAKSELDIFNDVRLSFWRSFTSSSNPKMKVDINSEKDLAEFFKNKLNFNDENFDLLFPIDSYYSFTEIWLQEIIHTLFIRFKVNPDDFSRHFSGLTFTNFFKNRIEDLKASYYQEFSSKIYEKLLNEPLDEKKKYFDYIAKYNQLEYIVEDGFLSDVENYFLDMVRSRFSVSLHKIPTNFLYSELCNQNLKNFAESEISVLRTLMIRTNIQSLLLFNEINELKKIIKQNSLTPTLNVNPNLRRINVKGEEIEYENRSALARKILDEIDFSKFKLKFSKTLAAVDGNKKMKIGGGTRNVIFNSKNEEDIGFISELLSYQLLCDKYGKENVRWISENSYWAEAELSGEAGAGYDLEIIEKGNVRFVEIKGISDLKKGIKITSNELKKAAEFPDKYDLLVVENPLGLEPIFRYIKNAFKFKKPESIFLNSRLRVMADNHIIKFNWDE